MSIALRIARRELRSGFKSFWLFCLCLTLGVGAIALVQSVSRAALDGVYDNGREILGGDISIDRRYTPPPQNLQALAQTYGEVSQSLTTSAFVSTIDSNEVVTVMLKAVDSAWPLYGAPKLSKNISLTEALAPQLLTSLPRAARWGAIAHPSLMARLGLEVGDIIKLNDIELEITAELLSEPDLASERGFPVGPRLLIAMSAFEASGLLVEGALMRWKTRLAIGNGEMSRADLAPLIAELEAAEGDSQVRSFTNAAPRVTRIINRMTVFLSLVSLAALIVGGIGMSDAVRAFLDSRLRTLAILKFIGASHETVAVSCLLQIVAMATLSIVLGLLLGAVGQMFAARLLGNALSINLETTLHLTPFLIAIAMGILITAIFGLWPLGRIRHARAADVFLSAIAPLSGWPSGRVVVGVLLCVVALFALVILTAHDRYFAAIFSAGAAGLLCVYWGVASTALKLMGLLPPFGRSMVRLGIGNLQRHRGAAVMVVQSLGLGLTVLTGIVLVERNISGQINNSLPEGAPSFFFLGVQAADEPTLRRIVDDAPDADLTASARTLYGRLITVNGQDAKTSLRTDDRWLVNGDRMVTFYDKPPENTELLAGTWWDTGYEGPPLVSVSNDITEGFGAKIGDLVTVRVLGREITAKIANVRNVEWGRQLRLDFVFIYTPNTFRGAPYQLLATAHTTPEAEPALLKDVATALPSVTMIRLREMIETINTLVARVANAIKSVASLVIFSAVIVLGGAIAASHRQRLYETVIFKTLGLTRKHLICAYLIEYGLIALIAATVALFAGGLVSWWIIDQILDADWTFYPSAAFGTLGLSAVLVIGMGFVGAWRVLGRPVRPELDQGG